MPDPRLGFQLAPVQVRPTSLPRAQVRRRNLGHLAGDECARSETEAGRRVRGLHALPRGVQFPRSEQSRSVHFQTPSVSTPSPDRRQDVTRHCPSETTRCQAGPSQPPEAGIAVVVFAVGGGSAKSRPAPSVPAASAVRVRSTSLGHALVDATGRSLYLFEGDGRDVSRLSSAGRSVWPRFVATGPVAAGTGVQMAKLGRTTNPGGVRQVTYNGHPLYYYVGDSKPGGTRGQALKEFGALWYVVSPTGKAVTSAPRTAKAARPLRHPVTDTEHHREGPRALPRDDAMARRGASRCITAPRLARCAARRPDARARDSQPPGRQPDGIIDLGRSSRTAFRSPRARRGTRLRT